MEVKLKWHLWAMSHKLDCDEVSVLQMWIIGMVNWKIQEAQYVNYLQKYTIERLSSVNKNNHLNMLYLYIL